MRRSLTRIAALALFAATAAPALHAAETGTRIRLESLPSYVERLFVPVVPQTENSIAIAALPAEAVLEAPAGFDVRIRRGEVIAYSDGGQSTGYARVRAGGREITLTLANAVPYERMQNGRLEGYRVGEYKPGPFERPKGFVRLTNDNARLLVSDHYRMKDFQCKLDGDAKFLVLRTEALVKLEILQHELATQHGVSFDRFTIMSGYRTPYYNARIGNETSSSRHLYGDAMDIYVDQNGDGAMDDINRDGRIDAGDARFLLRVAERIDNSQEWGWLKGGAGVYHANAAHGPYLHVDARGYVARWGAVQDTSTRGGVRTVSAKR